MLSPRYSLCVASKRNIPLTCTVPAGETICFQVGYEATTGAQPFPSPTGDVSQPAGLIDQSYPPASSMPQALGGSQAPHLMQQVGDDVISYFQHLYIARVVLSPFLLTGTIVFVSK